MRLPPASLDPVAVPPAAPVVRAAGTWASSAFFSATEDISAGTVWSINRDRDTVIVHFSGRIAKLETELEGCGAVMDPPMPGEVWVVPAGQRYVSYARGSLVHYAEIEMDRTAIKPVAGDRPIRSLAGHFDSFLHRGAQRLEQLIQSTDPLASLAAESLSHTLLLDFYARYGGEPAASARLVRFTPPQQEAIARYIHDNLGSALRLNALAGHVRMTPHEFLIAFRAAFGFTPAQYIIRQRLRRARWLLLNTSKSIIEIAFDTGFSSHAHLASAFHRHAGTAPAHFRRDYRQGRALR